MIKLGGIYIYFSSIYFSSILCTTICRNCIVQRLETGRRVCSGPRPVLNAIIQIQSLQHIIPHLHKAEKISTRKLRKVLRKAAPSLHSLKNVAHLCYIMQYRTTNNGFFVTSSGRRRAKILWMLMMVSQWVIKCSLAI